MSHHHTKKFKALQKVWYDKLKESGFEDIEDTNSPHEYLKTWHSSYFQIVHEPIAYEHKKVYYEQASAFLHEYFTDHQYGLFDKFRPDLVWELHVQGVSVREIAKRLEMKACRVHLIITDIKKKMMERLKP